MFFSLGVDRAEKYNMKRRKDNAAAQRTPRFAEKKEKADPAPAKNAGTG